MGKCREAVSRGNSLLVGLQNCSHLAPHCPTAPPHVTYSLNTWHVWRQRCVRARACITLAQAQCTMHTATDSVCHTSQVALPLSPLSLPPHPMHARTRACTLPLYWCLSVSVCLFVRLVPLGAISFCIKSYETYNREHRHRSHRAKDAAQAFGIALLGDTVQAASIPKSEAPSFKILLAGLLAVDPSRRWLSKQVVDHPWLQLSQEHEPPPGTVLLASSAVSADNTTGSKVRAQGSGCLSISEAGVASSRAKPVASGGVAMGGALVAAQPNDSRLVVDTPHEEPAAKSHQPGAMCDVAAPRTISMACSPCL